MSVVNIGEESLPEWLAGNGTVGETPAVLNANLHVKKAVHIRAKSDNSGTITIGPTAIQAVAGFVLGAGETSPPIYVDNLNKIWLVGSGSGQNYSWTCA